jgi:hypothetical protein
VHLVGVDRRFRALMMETVRTSEMSVYSNQTTRRYIPEGSIFILYLICLRIHLACYDSYQEKTNNCYTFTSWALSVSLCTKYFIHRNVIMRPAPGAHGPGRQPRPLPTTAVLINTIIPSIRIQCLTLSTV